MDVKALVLRNAMALLLLAAIGAAFAVLGVRRLGNREPVYHPRPAMTAEVAAESQQGVPTRFGEALALLDTELESARAQATLQPDAWSSWEEVANTYLDRARLTGSFEDYRAAGDAFDRAFAVAGPGLGPHVSHAGYNIALHRLAKAEPDLAAIEKAVVPDKAQLAVATGMRGDIAFYSGRYADARTLYERSHDMHRTLGTAFRLANYWGRMGDEPKARRYLDEAESGISGPQQETHAFIALDHGRWDEAQWRFHRADLIFPGHWLIQQYLARTVGLRGKPERSLAMFRTIFARTGLPDSADAIAGLYRSMGNRAQSEAWAARAEAIWRHRLALIPEAFGEPRRALALAQRNFAARPFAEAATGLAWAYMANHRPADAIRTIAPTLDSGWTAAEPHIVAAEAYALLGHGGEADAERRRALEINPHSFDRNPGMTWLEH
jgi:tetratricopeptide (TPR) repeat protein